jgi:hypothetical protein
MSYDTVDSPELYSFKTEDYISYLKSLKSN